METLFLSEYNDSNNNRWYSVYELNDTPNLVFLGSINFSHRYFMKGSNFYPSFIKHDDSTILFKNNNKTCIRIDMIFDKSSDIFKDIKNIVHRISKDKSIISYGCYNEEIHHF